MKRAFWHASVIVLWGHLLDDMSSDAIRCHATQVSFWETCTGVVFYYACACLPEADPGLRCMEIMSVYQSGNEEDGV